MTKKILLLFVVSLIMIGGVSAFQLNAPDDAYNIETDTVSPWDTSQDYYYDGVFLSNDGDGDYFYYKDIGSSCPAWLFGDFDLDLDFVTTSFCYHDPDTATDHFFSIDSYTFGDNVVLSPAAGNPTCESDLSTLPCDLDYVFEYSLGGNVYVYFSDIVGTIETGDILSGNDWVYVNPSSPANVLATIEFYNVNNLNAELLKDGAPCGASCQGVNNDGTDITFLVSGWSNYSYINTSTPCDDGNLTTMCMCNSNLTNWEDFKCYLDSELHLDGGNLVMNGTINMLNGSSIVGHGANITNIHRDYEDQTTFALTPIISEPYDWDDFYISNLTYTDTGWWGAGILMRTRESDMYINDVNLYVYADALTENGGYLSNFYVNDSFFIAYDNDCIKLPQSALVSYNSYFEGKGNVLEDAGTSQSYYLFNVDMKPVSSNGKVLDQTDSQNYGLLNNYWNTGDLNGGNIIVDRFRNGGDAFPQFLNLVNVNILGFANTGTLNLIRVNDNEIAELRLLDRCNNCIIYDNDIDKVRVGSLLGYSNISYKYAPGQDNVNFSVTTGDVTMNFYTNESKVIFNMENEGFSNVLSDAFQLGTNWAWANTSGLFDQNATIKFYDVNNASYGPLKDGYACGASCLNVVNDGENLTFDVTSWSNYTYGINPNHAPNITSKTPSGFTVTIDPGDALNLSINATDEDNDTLNYYWTLEGSPTGGNNSYYDFTEVLDNDYNVTANVTDASDYDYTYWMVTVNNLGPNIDSHNPASPATVLSNETINFSIVATDPNGETPSYQWYKDGGPLGGETDAYLLITGSMGTLGNYDYMVAALDEALNETFAWNVTISPAVTPEIILVPTPATATPSINEEDDINLSVTASDAANSSYTYSWTIGGSPLPDTDNDYYANGTLLGGGAHNIKVTVTSIYDTASFTWALTVIPLTSGEVVGALPIPTVGGVFDVITENLSTSIFGSALIAGLWLLLIIFGIGALMRIEMSILILLLMPVTLTFMALGYVPLVVGGILVMMSGLILAFSWWQHR